MTCAAMLGATIGGTPTVVGGFVELPAAGAGVLELLEVELELAEAFALDAAAMRPTTTSPPRTIGSVFMTSLSEEGDAKTDRGDPNHNADGRLGACS